MVDVPVISRQVEARGTPGVALRYNAPDVRSEGEEFMISGLNKLVQQEKERADETALMDAQMQADAWEANHVFDAQNGALAKKGKDAFDLPRMLGEKFDQDMNAIRDGLGSNEQKMAFQKFMLQRKSALSRTLEAHARGQMDEYEKNVATAETSSALNRAMLYFNDPATVEESVNRAKAAQVRAGLREGLPEAKITERIMETESKAHVGILARWADKDQRTALEYWNKNKDRFYGDDLLQAQKLMSVVDRQYKSKDAATSALASVGPKVDQDTIINYIMNDLEGGDKLVTDGNGAVAKFGINKAHNEDVDVENLTPEKAMEVYKNKYWKAFGADQLDPQMRLVAFDAYINGWDEKVLGKSLDDAVKDADGDPRRLLQTREEYYRKLAESPKHEKSLKGWLGRLTKISGQISTMYGETPSLTDVYAHIDKTVDNPDVADDAKALAKKQIEALEADRKNREGAASKEAWQYAQSGMEVPATVTARMNPKEAAEMMKKLPVDPELYEKTRNAILMDEDVNLEALKWRLKDKYDELLKLKSDPIQKAEASIIDRVVNQNRRVLLGKDNIETDDDRQKMARFRFSMLNEIKAASKSQGKPLSVEQINATVDRMLMNVDVKRELLWDKGMRFYEVPEQDMDKVEVPGLPENMEFFIGGVKLYPHEVMRQISVILRQKGLPHNKENIAATRKELLTKNVLKEVYPNGK